MEKGEKVLVVIAFVNVFSLQAGSIRKPDLLLFPKEKYTVETKIVMTSSGGKNVIYHSYMHILYVANPVDPDYQSLNVSVPVKVDNAVIDASNAPILFVIGVGGYMSVNNAGSSRSGLTGFSGGRQGGVPPPASGAPGRMSGNGGILSSRQDLALAAGIVVVSPGCRGRDNRAADGTFYGKAPAAIVDLKAAVRYIRHNRGILPGNPDRIISVGCSAGGALSALLGASGNSPLFEEYLKEIGSAEEKDNIFASACFSPVTDLEHADMAYEWNYGTVPASAGLVDQQSSEYLRSAFADYQASLKLQGKDDFGVLTADNYDEYLLQFYLKPSGDKYLGSLKDEKRKEYLEQNSWIKWTDKGSKFTFNDYVKHAGRMKGLPAFDDFDMKQPEPDLFGNKATKARHFTNFSLRHATGNMYAEIDNEVRELVDLMNAMYFIRNKNEGCAVYWWLRNGTIDNHTSQTVMINLATSLENLGKHVNAWIFWDGGHCADDNPEGFISWISGLTD